MLYVINAVHYYYIMNKNYRDKETTKVSNGRFSKKLPQDIQRIAARKLKMLNDAAALDDLRIPPSNYLEAKKAIEKGNIVYA